MKILITTLCFILINLTYAKDDRGGLYLGALIGSTTFGSFDDYDEGLEEDLENDGTTDIDVTTTGTSDYNKLYIGYRFGKYFSLEFNTGNYGTLKSELTGVISTAEVEVTAEGKLNYTGLDLIFYIPMNAFDLYFKFGSFTSVSTITTTTKAPSLNIDSQSTTDSASSGGKVGAGFQVHMGFIALRLDYETFVLASDTGNIPVTVLGAGLGLNF